MRLRLRRQYYNKNKETEKDQSLGVIGAATVAKMISRNPKIQSIGSFVIEVELLSIFGKIVFGPIIFILNLTLKLMELFFWIYFYIIYGVLYLSYQLLKYSCKFTYRALKKGYLYYISNRKNREEK